MTYSKPQDFFGNSPKTVLNKPFMHVQDQKAYNVEGGASVADAWTTRTLNTVIQNDITGASLSGNAVTLPAGTYYVEGGAEFTFGDGNNATHAAVIGIFNGSSKLLQGTSSVTYTPNAIYTGDDTSVAGVITLSSSTSISLKYYVGISSPVFGLGRSHSNGSITDPTIPNIYADLKIWQLDRSLEIAPKAVNSGLQTVPSLDTTGNIMGFDISKTGANQLTVTKGSCLDSTLEVAMALTVDTALAIPAVANTIYHIFIVRLVADGTFTVKAYTSEAGVASDGTVDKWRWIGFWRTNGSTECCDAYMKDGVMVFHKKSEIKISDTTGTKTAINHTPFVPVDRISMVVYRAVPGTAGWACEVYSPDGNLITTLGRAYTSVDTAIDAYGNDTINSHLMIPFNNNNLFLGASSGVGIQIIKLRR